MWHCSTFYCIELLFAQELFWKFTFCSLYRKQNVQGMLLATVKLKIIKYKIVVLTIIHMHNLHETEDLCIICFRVGLTLIIPMPLKQLIWVLYTRGISPHKQDAHIYLSSISSTLIFCTYFCCDTYNILSDKETGLMEYTDLGLGAILHLLDIASFHLMRISW